MPLVGAPHSAATRSSAVFTNCVSPVRALTNNILHRQARCPSIACHSSSFLFLGSNTRGVSSLQGATAGTWVQTLSHSSRIMRTKAVADEAGIAAVVDGNETTAVDKGSQRGPDRPPGLKRTVAMHVGYVGTAFRGLQRNGEMADEEAIEGVLEKAIYKAGLISESNYGSLRKIKWTRNSRTDKGVHSLSTVVGLRILIDDDERYVRDPEGLDLAAQVNAHLPPAVRIFSVQRVNKKFNSRRQCIDRTYEYYLPAYWLGIGPKPPLEPALAEVQAMKAEESTKEGAARVEAARMQAAACAAAAHAAEAAAAAGQQGTHQAPVLQPALELSQSEKATVELFRKALSTYVGRHPFHNYTLRKMYLTNSKNDRAERRVRLAAKDAARAAATAAAAAAEAASTSDTEDINAGILPTAAGTSAAEATGADSTSEAEGDAAAAQLPAAKKLSKRQRRRLNRGGDSDDDEEDEAAGPDDEDDEAGGIGGDEEYDIAAELLTQTQGESGNVQGTRRWLQSCGWVHELDERDRVIGRHYRNIMHFTADDPRPLVPGGIPCLRLEVRGESFMLHQIRHMIGGAVAVAASMIPMELLQASLSAPARITVPRAPPHTLFLSDCTYLPFRKAGESEALVSRFTGEALSLREGGAANVRAFRAQVFDYALNEVLSHPEWAVHAHQLAWFVWPKEQQTAVLAEHATWLEEARRQRELRAEQEAARKAAAAAAAAAETAAGTAVGDGDPPACSAVASATDLLAAAKISE